MVETTEGVFCSAEIVSNDVSKVIEGFDGEELPCEIDKYVNQSIIIQNSVDRLIFDLFSKYFF